MRSREELIAECDVVLLPKPLPDDLETLRPGQVLWGWPHCVQDRRDHPARHRPRADADRVRGDEPLDARRPLRPARLPQEQRARRLLLGAARPAAGRLTGDYGRRLSAVVIGFGATARGAVTGAQRARRPRRRRADPRAASPPSLADPLGPDRQFDHDPTAVRATPITDRGRVPLAPYLAEHDIVVNCILQDTDAPLIFLSERRPRPLPARQPDRRRLLRRGHGLRVGAPDHRSTTRCSPSATTCTTTPSTTAPSYLWNSATWENSEALLPFLPVVMAGPDAWDADETIRRAIEIRDGPRREPADPLLPGALARSTRIPR